MLELFPRQSPFVIYRSSAGSGKTYTLTREYITLALRRDRPNSFKRILAVTFTNKAMQEMKDRIVDKLHEFSEGKKDPMADEIIGLLGLTAADFRKRCGALLSAILHEYSHFAVTTIDAFFQQVIRSFARELQVGGNYHLELDQELIYNKVVESLMSELKDNDNVRRWVTEFSNSKLEEGRGWEIDRELVGFLNELDKDTFREHDISLWELSAGEIKDLMHSTGAVINQYQTRLTALAERADQILKQYGLVPGDLFGNNIHTIFTKILAGDFDYKMTKTQKKALNEGVWHRANSENESSIKSAVENGYAACLQQVSDIISSDFVPYNTARAIYRNIYLLSLTNELLKKLAAYKREHDMMFIADATTMLKELVADVDAPFIYEKVGGFYENFLIDEFQDTSVFQWESFKPLILNSLAENHRNLIVGDVKQSIYRWRGGKLELLQSEAEKAVSMYKPAIDHLDTNYRSATRIIQFNNAVFTVLPGLIEEAVENHGTPFGEVYEQAVQKTRPGSKESGYVEIDFLDSDGFRELALERMLETLIHLQKCNVPLSETAILVRANAEARQVADFLLSYRAANPSSPYSFEIVSSESLHLSTSSAVCCIISALRFVNDPADLLNESAVKRFLYELNRSDMSLEEYLLGAESAAITELKKRINQFRRLPLYSLVEQLIDVLGLQQIVGELPYLLTFQDAVLNFTKSGKGDISGLLELWDELLHKQSIQVSTEINAIRILTIHKVKGLEFHSVIIPFADWQFSRNQTMEWFQYENDSRKYLLPLNFSSKLNETEFASQYQTELSRRYLDNLNMIYVAFTRAVHDLWCFTRRTEKRGGGRTSDVLNSLIHVAPVSDLNESADGIFTYGKRQFDYEGNPPVERDTLKLHNYESSDWQQRLTLKPAPRRTRNEQHTVSISLGIIVHDILSEVVTISDLEHALENAKYTAGLDEGQVDGLMSRIRLAFRNEEISSWFSDQWVVKNETAIFLDGSEYRPDRVMIGSDSVVVVDYKTGKKKSSDGRQMEKYISLLANMYDLPVSGRILYLEDLEIVAIG